MGEEKKTYLINYKNHKNQTVTGRVVLFSPKVSTDVARHNGVVYVNAEEVLSITEQLSLNK